MQSGRRLPKIEFKTETAEVKATVDTACLVTCVREDIANSLGGTRKAAEGAQASVYGLGGEIQVKELQVLRWMVQGYVLEVPALVVPNLPTKMLIGDDV